MRKGKSEEIRVKSEEVTRWVRLLEFVPNFLYI
jgi:hypothetical protein